MPARSRTRTGRRALVALAAGLLAAGCSGPRAGREYLPLAVGNRWDYVVATSDGAQERRRMAITGRLSADTFTATDGGEPGAWSWEDGFLSFQQGGSRAYLLMLPASPGVKWWTVTPEGARVSCEVTGFAKVTTPAGVFPRCVEVLMETVGGRTEMRHWFAPGVGWVRHSSGPRGGRPWVVRYLVDYELRRPEAAAGGPVPDGAAGK